ncbi:hypothetical protein [Gloeothece verrucosa]|uniref:hypothetical protein n=1 Tax=Gloeothece verrucosa TaxID=2546359 RepID=UPI0012FF4636|nr:hypothetical protein [Gloeothece verrucosa]
MIWYVYRFGVNVPFYDDWALVYLFEQLHKGTTSFNDFFVQHNEHRIVFPKVIFAILAFASNWNIKLEMYFSVFLSVINFYLIYKISEFSSRENKNFFHLFNILTCFLLFSWVQYENWLWGFQIAWFFINTCFILAVFFLTVPPNFSPFFKLTMAGLCCFIASFSSAHGLLSWLAVIPCVLAVEGNKKQKIIRLFIWVTLFGLCCLIYSFGYHKPSYHPSLFFALEHFLIALEYFFSLLGASIIIVNYVQTGILIALVFLFFNFYTLKKYRSQFALDVTPWLSIGWFTILFALLTTLGRSGFGVGQALSSRYTSISILLIISCLQIARLFIINTTFLLEKKIFKKFALSGITGISIVIIIFMYDNGISTGLSAFQSRTIAKDCLTVINFFEPSSFVNKSDQICLKDIFTDFKLLKYLSVKIDTIGFINLNEKITFNPTPIQNYGEIEQQSSRDKTATLSKNQSFEIKGWATLPKPQQLPPLILLSYDDKQSFFTTASMVEFNQSNHTIKWQAQISPQSLPLGETMLKAWVYDRENKQFVKLKGEIKVNVI